MHRFVAVATIAALAAACGPSPGATPGASTSPAASKAPSPGSSAAASAAPVVVATPTPARTPSPVTLKVTIDGKPATIEPLAFVTQTPGTGNLSLFWNVGAFAKSGEANIGQGYNILKEGEGNITIHMKMPLTADNQLDLRTLTESEFAGAANMTYKEGPRALVWYANGQRDTGGSFTVEGDTITFKMTAEIAGNKRENDGTAHKFDIEITGLPKP